MAVIVPTKTSIKEQLLIAKADAIRVLVAIAKGEGTPDGQRLLSQSDVTNRILAAQEILRVPTEMLIT